MVFRGKRIYISNFSGLANRLECLVLATLIEEQFGHTIYLQWPEEESLAVRGTHTGRITPWERLYSHKVRDFDKSALQRLGCWKVISLRATYGPRDLQRKYLHTTAQRLSPHPKIREELVEAFKSRGSRPAVGVHIRHGDFVVPAQEYDANAHRHPAAPLWWYEHVMETYVRRFPEVYFVLGYSGDPLLLRGIRQRFDTLSLRSSFSYRTLLPGHISNGHPVTDLFGLACCGTLVASPTSSFSHWAANVLGPETCTLLPPPYMHRTNPALGVARLQGTELLAWREAAEIGRDVTPVNDFEALPVPNQPDTTWL